MHYLFSTADSYDHKLNKYNGKAYFGITDMAKDIDKAEMLEFTKSDVTLYPDNQKPGKIRIKWKIFT